MNTVNSTLFDTMSLVELAPYMPEGGFKEVERALAQRGITCTSTYVSQLMAGKTKQPRYGETTLKIEQIRIEAVKIAKKYYETTHLSLEAIRRDKLEKIKAFLESEGGELGKFVDFLTMGQTAQGEDEEA